MSERDNAAPIGYAVQMNDGHFVGIWLDRDTAELVCAKQPPSHGDKVIPVYAAPQAGKLSNPLTVQPSTDSTPAVAAPQSEAPSDQRIIEKRIQEAMAKQDKQF